MIFYKVILYGVNFVLPHSMSAKNKIKFLVFTKKDQKKKKFWTPGTRASPCREPCWVQALLAKMKGEAQALLTW